MLSSCYKFSADAAYHFIIVLSFMLINAYRTGYSGDSFFDTHATITKNCDGDWRDVFGME